MNDIRNVSRAGKNTRRIQQSTITRAVRSVLAASACSSRLGGGWTTGVLGVFGLEPKHMVKSPR